MREPEPKLRQQPRSSSMIPFMTRPQNRNTIVTLDRSIFSIIFPHRQISKLSPKLLPCEVRLGANGEDMTGRESPPIFECRFQSPGHCINFAGQGRLPILSQGTAFPSLLIQATCK